MPTPRLLLFSNTKLHGQEPFQFCPQLLHTFFSKSHVKKLLFIPYAMQDYDEYLKKMKPGLALQGFDLEGIHTKPDPVSAVYESEGIYIGGGNTFLLLKTLYEEKLIEPIRDCVLNKSIPFMGSSAGTNVATRSISTTNDMPICYPPSFEALNLVPFNINPHYLDPDPSSTHMGETRAVRIREYLQQENSSAVLGMREGSCLLVEDGKAILKGLTNARLFQKGKEPVEYEPESDLSFLLDSNN